MTRRPGPAWPAMVLDPQAATPLQRQIFEQVREGIVAGRIPAGTRLPSSRAAARELGVSRATVVQSFAQLQAEGYLVSRRGAGLYVSAAIPERSMRAPAPVASPTAGRAESGPALSARARALVALHRPPQPETDAGGRLTAFPLGIPALDELPLARWARLRARHWRRASGRWLGYHDAAGYPPLRRAIADYLGFSRGVVCEPEQVIVVNGSQQALSLSVQALLEAGDTVWLEDPGYPGARAACAAGGARMVPVPVDAEGLCVDEGIARAADARMAFLTPAHQFPLGVPLSLSRRMQLLEWAYAQGAWLFEDDYDSEFRYQGRPLGALFGLDRRGRVIYCGTFSKVLFPSLRLGYLVVPPALVDPFTALRWAADVQSPALEQAVLADYIGEGFFLRHIRRMRTLYAERRALLAAAVRAHFPREELEIFETHAGMHSVAWLGEGLEDRRISEGAARLGVQTLPLSPLRHGGGGRGALLLGYAATPQPVIDWGVRGLREVIDTVKAGLAKRSPGGTGT